MTPPSSWPRRRAPGACGWRKSAGGEFARDAANRFLHREACSPHGLARGEMRALIVLEGGVLSVDDTVLDKPHSQEGKTEWVGYFCRGLHGRAVKGISLVTLFYGEAGGLRVPVNFPGGGQGAGQDPERPVPGDGQ